MNIRHIHARIADLLCHIQEEITLRQTKDNHILRALLYEMLMLLDREYAAHYPVHPSQASDRYIDDFVRLVDTHFKIRHDTTSGSTASTEWRNIMNALEEKYG